MLLDHQEIIGLLVAVVVALVIQLLPMDKVVELVDHILVVAQEILLHLDLIL